MKQETFDFDAPEAIKPKSVQTLAPDEDRVAARVLETTHPEVRESYSLRTCACGGRGKRICDSCGRYFEPTTPKIERRLDAKARDRERRRRTARRKAHGPSSFLSEYSKDRNFELTPSKRDA